MSQLSIFQSNFWEGSNTICCIPENTTLDEHVASFSETLKIVPGMRKSGWTSKSTEQPISTSELARLMRNVADQDEERFDIFRSGQDLNREQLKR